MDTRRLVDGFVIELRRQGLSQHTARAYARDLGRFLEAVGGPGPHVLTPDCIARYLDDLACQGSPATTIARRLTSIRRFCHLLTDRGILPSDPTEGISAPLPPPGVVCLDRDAVMAVVESPDPGSKLGTRDRAIMMLLIDTGMELCELCALNLRDCVDDTQRLLVGSGRRRRNVFLYCSRGALLRYLYFIRDDLDGEALFQSNRGTRISARAVQHRVRQYAEAGGAELTVEDLIHYGRMRRTWGDRSSVARQLGCARPDAAQQRYRFHREERQPAPEPGVLEHPHRKPRGETDSRGMSAPPAEVCAPTRADMWDCLERGILQLRRLPRPAGEEWLKVTGLVHLPPEERLRTYAKPVARLIREAISREESRQVPEDPRVQELAQQMRASDEVLLGIHSGMVAVDAEFGRWLGFTERLDALLGQRRRSGTTREPDWTDMSVPMLTFGSPERVLDWADRVLSTREGQDALRLLLYARWPDLMWLRDCAARYYSVPRGKTARRELDAALVVAAIAGAVLCSPEAAERARASEAVENPAGMYFVDTVMYVLHQLLRLLDLAEDGSALSGIENDEAFIDAFEREWDALVAFTNGFFGFAVVPRITYEDMVRYHQLCYAPHGDLASIAYEVGDYLVHQAKASGHFLRSFVQDLLHEAFLDCVRPLYDKLHRSFGHKARCALTRQHQEQDGDEIFDRADRETEAAFREAYDRYDFYQHPPGGPQTTVTEGLLGWRRREDIRMLAEELGIDCEQARTPFAAYARGYLDRLVKRLRRESIGEAQGKRVQGPDGKYYYTISKASAVFKRGVHALRCLDDLLQPLSVSEVFGDHVVGRQGLPGCVRLYPADAESIKEYGRLLSELHPTLENEGLRTEAQVARWLGVGVWWLRNRRKRGRLQAARKGHFVVYSAAQRIAARELLREETGVTQEK